MRAVVVAVLGFLSVPAVAPTRALTAQSGAVVRVATTSCVRAVLGCMLFRRSTRTVPTAMARISRCRRCVWGFRTS